VEYVKKHLYPDVILFMYLLVLIKEIILRVSAILTGVLISP